MSVTLNTERNDAQFEAELTKWEGYITKIASHILGSLNRGNSDFDDITNWLRETIWRAYTLYNPDKGTKLTSWIIECITNEKRTIYETLLNQSPKHFISGVLIPIVYIDGTYNLDNDDDVAYQLEDVNACAEVEEPLLREMFHKCVDAIKSIVRPEDHVIIEDIISNEWTTDMAIATRLGKDFATVSEVRLKLKMGFAIIYEIPPTTFTINRNAYHLYNSMLIKFKTLGLVDVSKPFIPNPPKNLIPGITTEPGVSILTTTPKLSWTNVPHATCYEVTIYSYPYTENYMIYKDKVNESCAIIPLGILINGKSYRWFVRSINSDGVKGWISIGHHFKVNI